MKKREDPIITPQSPGWRDPASAYRSRRNQRSVWRFILSFVIPPKYYRLRPTISGWMLILVSMALGGAAYNSSSNILFMCLSLMMGCLVLSGMLSYLNFTKMRWTLEVPEHLRSGETGLGRIWVENGKRRVPVFVLWFHVRAGAKGKKTRIIMSERLDPKSRLSLNWHIPSLERGSATLWVSGVESQYPFGFLKKNIGIPIEREVMVWPRRQEYRLSFGQGKRVLAGVGKSQLIGEGVDLSGLREYRLGDDLRKVHWKASARSEELMLKEFSEENATGFRVWFQTSKTLWRTDESFEVACALVGSIVEDLYRRGELQAFKLDDGESMDGRSSADFHAIMGMLSDARRGQGHFELDQEPTHHQGLTFKPGEGTAVEVYLGVEHVGTTIQ
ncbi:MAG: DUF58 domain-containing protein [Opitutales bacterium]